MEKFVERKIEEKHIEIAGFDKMNGVIIEADRDLIQQVIYNLFDNAMKFTPENGKITVPKGDNPLKIFVRK